MLDYLVVLGLTLASAGVLWTEAIRDVLAINRGCRVKRLVLVATVVSLVPYAAFFSLVYLFSIKEIIASNGLLRTVVMGVSFKLVMSGLVAASITFSYRRGHSGFLGKIGSCLLK